MEVVASLSQGRTAAAQCGLFTYKSVPVIFEPPCTLHVTCIVLFLLAFKKAPDKKKVAVKIKTRTVSNTLFSLQVVPFRA